MSEPLRDSVSIRSETPDDRAPIYDVHLQAFSNDVEPNLVAALRESGEAVISLAAVAGGVVVGHVLFSPMRAPMRSLALAPVAVLPQWQRQGVGSALIREGLRQAREAGWEAVFVVGDPAYYSRFGFDAAAAREFSCPYAGDYFMGLFLADGQPRSGVLAYAAPFEALS